MILLWFADMVLGMVGNMTYGFFYGFEYGFKYGWENDLCFFYDFGKVSLSQFFFYHRNSFLKQIPTKIVEKM